MARPDLVLACLLAFADTAFAQTPDTGGSQAAPPEYLRPAGAHAVTLAYGSAAGNVRLKLISAPAVGASESAVKVQDLLLDATTEELAALVAEVRRLARVRPPASLGRIVRLGDDLGQLLLAPAAGSLQAATHLALVANGPLADLPFGAIRVPRSLDPQGRYLVETRTLCWVDPALDAANFGPAAEARDASQPVALAIADAVHRRPARPLGATMSDGGISWRQHAARRNQAGTALALGLPVIRRYGADASPGALQASAELQPVQLLHLAVEAVVNAEAPERSALLLSPARHDQQAIPVEAVALPDTLALAPGGLVVLSGLDTGGHGIGPGPFVRAFGAAGAETVAASLWPVVDESATRLFAVLYGEIARGTGPAEALRKAQLGLLRTPLRFEQGEGRDPVEFDASHPWFWAGYRVYRPSAEACARGGLRASLEH